MLNRVQKQNWLYAMFVVFGIIFKVLTISFQYFEQKKLAPEFNSMQKAELIAGRIKTSNLPILTEIGTALQLVLTRL